MLISYQKSQVKKSQVKKSLVKKSPVIRLQVAADLIKQALSKEDFVLWKSDMRLAKKKNVVSRVKNVTWKPLMNMGIKLMNIWEHGKKKKKCGFQSKNST